MKKIFVPIFKTKARAEKDALNETINLMGGNIIPYIDINKSISNPLIGDYLNLIKDKKHFIGFVKNDSVEKNILSNISLLLKSYPSNDAIYTINADFLSFDNMDDIIDGCKRLMQDKIQLAFKFSINNDVSIIKQFLKQIDNFSYVIVDVDEDDYFSSSFYIKDMLKNISKNTKIIIFSTERPTTKVSETYNIFGVNRDFNTSVINEIKNNKFEWDGFGSYCGAKNNDNETQRSSLCFGVFLIYNFYENSFFSVRSLEKTNSGKAYSDLKPIIINKYRLSIESKFSSTPKSLQMLKNLLDGPKKGNASKYIAIGIVKYIEEIYNHY